MKLIKTWALPLLLLSFIGGCSSVKQQAVTDTPSTPAVIQPAPTKTAPPPANAESTAPSATAQATDPFSSPIPFDQDAVMGTLANGMRYYIRKNAQPANYAELRLAVNAGSILEEEDQQGLAHFVEHMAFNGTKNFPKNDLIDYLESIGVKFGAHLNAYTSFDETVYMLRLPTDSLPQFEKGMQIMEDWAHNVVFEGVEIDKERGVVIEEWRQGLGASERMRQQTFPVSFYNSQYAVRLPIGKQSILESFKHERLIQFYKDWYRPDLMAVVAVGDFDVAQVEQMIKDKFGKIPAAQNARERTLYPVPNHVDTKIAIAVDPEATRSSVSLDYKRPLKAVKTLSDYRESLITSLCSRMLDARLEELKQLKEPPFAYAYTNYGSMVRTKNAYSSYAIVPTGGHLYALESLLVENERAARHGFTESELERAKKQLLTRLDRAVKEGDKTSSGRLVWRYVRHFLSGSPAISSQDRLKLAQEFLPKIPLRDVNYRFKTWIKDDNRVVILDGPDKPGVEMPTEADVWQLLQEVKEMDIQPYRDEVVRAPLMGARPDAGKIKNTETRNDLGITEITFSNGARVILKPTDFKNDEISMRASSPGGHSLVNDQQYMSASMAAQVVANSGLGPYSPNQLEKFLSDKVVRLSPYISELEEGFRGSTSVKDQEVFLQMLHLYFTAPRKDKTAFDATMARQQSFYENLLSNPVSYFNSEVSKTVYGDHLRRGYPTLERLGQVDYETAHRIFRHRFGDISDFTFIFVGNIEVEPFTEMLASYVGSIPPKNRKETWKDVGADIKRGIIDRTIKKGKEPKSAVRMLFSGDFEWDLDNRYDMMSMVQVLRIMLRESMREEKGGVYGVRASASPRRNPKETYSISISFQCAPENAEELINTAMKDIENLQKEGPSDKNLKKVQETQRKDIEVGMEQNSYWLSRLGFYYGNGLDPSLMKETVGRIDSLTAKRVQEAAKRYFGKDNYIKVVLYPEGEGD